MAKRAPSSELLNLRALQVNIAAQGGQQVNVAGDVKGNSRREDQPDG